MFLIIGGNGFVGRHVAHALLDEGAQVTVTAHSRPALPPDLAARPGISVARLDVTDPYATMELVGKLRPHTLIDLSGHAPKALSPAADVNFRVAALLNMLEAARVHDLSRVLLMSSADVYWGLPTAASPYHEDDPVPLLESDDHMIVQSWVKKSLEIIGNLYRRQHGMPIHFIRASGIYGPGYRTYLNAPSRLVRATATGNPIPMPERPFAQAGYDQLYVTDAARGIRAMAMAPTLAHAAYNIGSGSAPRYDRFARALMALRPDVDLTLPDRGDAAPDPMDGRYMSIDRARAELGFAPGVSPEDAMGLYLDHLLRNPDK